MKNKKGLYNLLFLVCAVMALPWLSCNSKGGTNSPESEANQLHTESIYQLATEWHTQNSDTILLSELKGKLPVMAMIFTSCGYACPRIVADMKHIEEQVPADKRDQVMFVLVSFDSEVDTPERLSEFAREMQLGPNWLLLHGEDDAIRTLSMVLDVQYKEQDNGHFAHSNSITLLDKEGVISARVEGLGTDPQALLSKLAEL